MIWNGNDSESAFLRASIAEIGSYVKFAEVYDLMLNPIISTQGIIVASRIGNKGK
jgi:hypothetical protein